MAVDDRTGGLTMHLPKENNRLQKTEKIFAKTSQLLTIENPIIKLSAKYRKY